MTHSPALPVFDIPDSLHWRALYGEIIFSNPPYLVLHATPVFALCHSALVARGIVWDVFELIKSCKRPGAYYLVTAECGYPDDAYIKEAVQVSHPDENSVVWELDIEGLRPALDDALEAETGFVRLTFQRQDYESSIRTMLRELQAIIARRVTVAELPDTTYGIDVLRTHYPDITELRVEEFEPGGQGAALERLREMDVDAPWAQEPIWPDSTVVEFGFFKTGTSGELMAVNGQPLQQGWPGWYFTRWEALAAFKAWTAFVRRGFALPPGLARTTVETQNIFFLMHEADRACCHAAGRMLAQIVQLCYEEGKTAPGVTVRYREVNLPLAVNTQ